MQCIGRVCALLGAILLLSTPPAAFPQSVDNNLAPDDEQLDEIIVTGSRIKRSTYTSIAPLQIIDAQESRETGLVDAATILQEFIAATGIQHNLHAVGFITENGPGAANISLRGLGNARTLVLINGHRLAPAGVEGAPIAADLNLVPGLLVEQYEMLLDGASSIYGSDAVAGVVNVILRKDFDGVEAGLHTSQPDHSGGISNTISLAWGTSAERGSLGLGFEHQETGSVSVDQRRWSAECDRYVEVDENGEFRHTGIRNQFQMDMGTSDCKEGWLVGTVEVQHFIPLIGGIDPGPILVFHTPGFSNTGIPNYSDGNYIYLPGGLDGDGDGQQDISHYDYSYNGLDNNKQLTPEFERTSGMMYGDYRISEENNTSAYFELQYGQRKHQADSGLSLFATVVPETNPFNPCNPDGLDGVDCILAWNDFYQQQTVIDRFLEQYGATPQDLGGGMNEPFGAIGVGTYLVIPGDRNLVRSEVSQARIVAGIRGDLPTLDRGSLNSWHYDAALQYSRSMGTSSRPGIRQDWLDQSLDTSAVDPATGEVICGEDTDGDGVPDGVNPDGRTCVPVNLFTPSLFENLIGAFSTQEQHDYLFDTRDFETEYEQLQFTAYASGDLFEMPAGTVAAVFGVEYREDSIKSIPDDVARYGLFHRFEGDAGAVGKKNTREIFAEVEMPLFADRPAAKELTTNLSARHVRDEYFGSHTTYSAKVGWRPLDSLLLRATVGTSFRAPNLRENFLVNLQGSTYVWDPCIPPEGAFDLDGTYHPERDNRETHIQQNCAIDGVDPAAWIYGPWQGRRVGVDGGGTTELTAETSDSYSLGLVWDYTFFDTTDMTVGVTYYEIDIADTILKPNAAYVVNDCYNSPGLNSVLCSRITRDPDLQYLGTVNTDFINRDQYLASGFDINASLRAEFTLVGQPVDLTIDLVLNHPTEASETFTDVLGNVDFDDQAGEWGYPDWLGTLTIGASVRDLQFTWRTRMIGAVDQDPLGIDDWSDVTVYPGSDTCLGPSYGDVLCRDVGFAEDYFVHAASLFYYGDTWTIGAGIRNVFDEAPPEVDGSEVLSLRNMPLGYGYDLNGRTYFLNLQARFH